MPENNLVYGRDINAHFPGHDPLAQAPPGKPGLGCPDPLTVRVTYVYLLEHRKAHVLDVLCMSNPYPLFMGRVNHFLKNYGKNMNAKKKLREFQGIGERMKQVRGKMSQEELGKQIGFAKNTISNYELEKSSPNLGFLRLFCDFFNVSLHWLQTGQGPMYKSEAVKESPPQDFSSIRLRLESQQYRIMRSVMDEAKRLGLSAEQQHALTQAVMVYDAEEESR